MNKDISVHAHSKANTVAISTINFLPTNKLLSIKNLPLGPEEEPAEMTRYKALSRNQCRGAVYLQGKYRQEAIGTLMHDLDCHTTKSDAVLLLGKIGNTILTIFEESTPPRKNQVLLRCTPGIPVQPEAAPLLQVSPTRTQGRCLPQ